MSYPQEHHAPCIREAHSTRGANEKRSRTEMYVPSGHALTTTSPPSTHRENLVALVYAHHLYPAPVSIGQSV